MELKNGETFNGVLASCDNWMNINLREVICTSREGDRFWRMSECYVRGPMIKYLRIADEVIDTVKEDVRSHQQQHGQPNRGGQGGQGGQGGGQGGQGGQQQRRYGKRPAPGQQSGQQHRQPRNQY